MSLSRKEKIVIFAVILFACVIVVGSGIFEKKQSEPKAKNRFFENPFSEVDPGIDQQSGNYANDALVVDGYVYFYKSRVKLGNYDKIDELEKCGNNVIYRLSPDGTYEEFYTFDEGDAIYYSIGSKLYYYEGYFYIQIENRIYRINKEGTEAQVIYENVGGYGSYVTFGIRDHYLVLQKQTEYYYLDMDTWDWSQPIEVGRMWHLMNVRCSYDAVRRNQLICFFENVIYGTEKEEPIGVYFESNMLYGSDFVYLHDLRVYVDEVNLENTLTKNITLFQLLHIMSPYDLDLESRWSNSKIYKTMAAPIGVKSGDEIVYLDLHEKYHGPHGLVAGTTGSGKSEILQTYILSMATLFHPYEVGFIIIDFKGGGMVNQFKDLPHLNGAITNMDGNEIERSLLSIKAELVKRQELFAKLEVNHIDDYIKAYKDGKAKIPLPHLILIVDEFAELKSEQPEFMKELISAARIGRSLGVHLILATQKPSGVVSDQIWSNSKFKLCLKVQNKNDSNEVLKSPLAAEIKEPGRAYLQVGNNEIFQLFQSAYSGVTAKTDGISAQKKFALTSVALSGKRSVIYEQKPNEDDAGETQLKAIVNYVNEFCEKKGISRLPNICLPALPEKLPFTLDGFSYTGTDIVVPVGVVDDPSRQRQYVETWNISQNNFYILGSAQSGKTNLLQTMICGLAMRYSPKDVQMYILDFASMILRNFETLNHVGGVITSTDEQRLKGFLKMMQETVQVRKKYFSQLGLSSYSAYRESGQTELPQIVIFLDNWVAFRGYYPDYEDQIISISRESVAAGISFVVTAGQAGGAGFKLLSNFSKRTALYCNDSSDYGVVFEACRKKLHDIAGRGLIEADKMYYEIQYYLAFAAEKEFEKITLMKAFIDQIHDQYGDMYVPGIPEIPQKVTEAYMAKQFGTSYKSYEIPLGMEFETIGRRTLDLGQTPLLAFVGAKDSSKHQYVEYLLDRALRNQDKAPVDVYLMDDTAGEYRRFESDVSGYTQTTEGAAELLNIAWQKLQKQETPASLQIIVVNSPEIMKQIGTDKAMVDLYRQISMAFKSAKGCFLLTDVENAMISFSAGELLKQVRDTKSFIIFENIKNIKVTDISMGVARTFKKELDVNDAYVIQGDKIERVRVVQKG